MSVLLDALKKAAEEKKALEQLKQRQPFASKTKNAEATVDDNPQSTALDLNDAVDANQTKALDFSLSFTDEVGVASPSDNENESKIKHKTESQTESHQASVSNEPDKLSLKLTADNAGYSAQVESESETPNEPKPAASGFVLKMAEPEPEVVTAQLDLEALEQNLETTPPAAETVMSQSQKQTDEPKDIEQEEAPEVKQTAEVESSPAQAVEDELEVKQADQAPEQKRPSESLPEPEPIIQSPHKQAASINRVLGEQVTRRKTEAPAAGSSKTWRWVTLSLLLTLLIIIVLAWFALQQRDLLQMMLTDNAQPVPSPVITESPQTLPSVKPETSSATQESVEQEAIEQELAQQEPSQQELAVTQEDAAQTKEPDDAVMAESNVETIAESTPEPFTEKPTTKPVSEELISEESEATEPSAQAQPVSRYQISHVETVNYAAQAYHAYRQGRLEEAAQNYQKLLLQNPQSKVALMGLAAVSAEQGDYQAALNNYQRVLSQHPDDADALQAIAAISAGFVGDASLERDLLDLVARFPDSAALHFALGNYYAQQSDWFKAQQAYFDSVVRDQTNADYRLNLAVSFDRIGQYAMAIEHYQYALQLAAAQPRLRFDPSAIERRIRLLQQFVERGQ